MVHTYIKEDLARFHVGFKKKKPPPDVPESVPAQGK
jgi:hypothetical protein